MIHFKEPKELFDQFREDYFTQKNPAGLLQQLALASVHSKTFVYPYCDPEVVTYFRGFDWYGLNKPHQKHHVLTAYPEFATVGRPKHHINLQLGAGIDVAFEALLLDNRINFMQRGRMLEVYRGWEDHLPSEPMITF